MDEDNLLSELKLRRPFTNQGIIDYTVTETRQIFFLCASKGKDF